jgi:hypothetical protein
MKNMIVVLTILFLNTSAFAQENGIRFSLLNSFLKTERNNHGWLFGKNNAPFDHKRFTKLYNQQHTADKKTAKRITFMDGPVVFSTTAVEASGSQNPLGLRPVYITGTPSTALEILGFAARIFAPALAPRNHLPTEPTPMQAYLQSTYRQHQ